MVEAILAKVEDGNLMKSYSNRNIMHFG